MAEMGQRYSCHVRYTSNSDHIGASQRNVEMCQSRPNAAQQNPLLFDHLAAVGSSPDSGTWAQQTRRESETSWLGPM